MSGPQTLFNRYSSQHPLLLVTDFSADSRGGGGVIIRSLLKGNEDKIAWVTLSGRAACDAHYWPSQVSVHDGSLVGAPFRKSAESVAKRVLEVIEARGARAIWIILHNTSVHVAAALSRLTRLPIHVTVHDDPAYSTTLRSRRNFFMTPFVDRDFMMALRSAKSIDVISAAMSRRYKSRYGVDSTVIHRALGPDHVTPAPRFDRAAHQFHIALLGSTYRYAQLPVLAQALLQAGKIVGAEPRITICGEGKNGLRLKKQFAGRVDVRVVGHAEEPAAVPLLQSAFLMYLNYPFTWLTSVLRQTSFPTKLSTYVMTSRPLLVHAPSDSSIGDLALLKPYVHWWGDMRPETGAQTLISAWQSSSMDESFHEQAESLRKQFFDQEKNAASISGMLNALVEPSSNLCPEMIC